MKHKELIKLKKQIQALELTMSEPDLVMVHHQTNYKGYVPRTRFTKELAERTRNELERRVIYRKKSRHRISPKLAAVKGV